ncbi:MAG: AAA family ATPase, partial [Oscillibacter sp.]|nr:AAA family ATPase [Oscillibacter sp.]
MEPVKITQLEAENIKRIKAVQITPSANGLTIIGGNNSQGKTSALDAIVWALGGDRYRPSQPQRDGSVLPPHIRMELSNGIVVERTGKNSDLKVTDSFGKRAGQQLLNSFVEQFALDMPKFMQATSKDKATTLLRIIGMEDQVIALEQQEAQLYNQRRTIGQIADQKGKYAKGLPSYPDAPNEPVSASELIRQQQDILARNGENQRKRARAAEIAQQKAVQGQQLDALRKQVQEAEARYAALCQDCETAQKDALDLLDESTAELEKNIRDIDAINTKVRTNQAKAAAEAEAKQYSDQYEGLTAQIEGVRKQKQDLLNGANLPLPGLSVENGELTYMGKN